MLSIASLNPSTPFNHFPDYAVHYIFNHHSLLPSTFSLPSIRIPVALPPPTDHSTCAPLMPFNSSTMNQITQGHIVLTHSRSEHYAATRNLGISFFQNPDNLC
ncbi:hypothetical protein HN51_016373 [Arachis hypogaea]